MLPVKLTALGLLLCGFCLLTCSGITLGRENGSVVVEEGSDVILSCSPSTKENLVRELFDWVKDGQQEVFLYDAGLQYNNGRQGQDPHFKDRVSHFTDELKYGNASIMIRNTKVADSGDYTCDFPRLQPSETFHIKLVVEPTFRDRAGEIAGASPEPVIRILNVTEDGVLLQCDVRGASPQPEVQWQDSAGNNLPAEEPQVSYRGGRHYVTLLATVTKADNFHCVVTQKEIHHETSAETFVPFCDSSSKVHIGWLFGAMVLGAAVVAVAVVAKKLIKKHCKKGASEGSEGPTSEVLVQPPANEIALMQIS